MFDKTEGKSLCTIAIVSSSVIYLERFLESEGLTTDVAHIGPSEIRGFILYLQQKRCFSDHRFTKPQEKGLSRHSINCYLRSIRSFWSWLVSEEIIEASPFARVKIPKAPRKIMPTFSNEQIGQLLGTIDTSTPEGYRDQAIILTLLDTGLRVSELTGITLDDLQLEEGTIKVMGKGNKERLVPMGKKVQRALWHYLSRYRPQPEQPKCKLLSLTREGMPLTKDRIEKIMSSYGRKAALSGVRCSPHTLRHTAAISFLRNGGGRVQPAAPPGTLKPGNDQALLRVADVDVKNAHLTASPVDNLASVPSRGSGSGGSTYNAQKNRR